MRIVAGCRTLNEAHNVERFIAAHRSFVDDILIADGGSTDNTVELAQEAGAKVRLFHEMVQCASGGHRNPYGRHINFMIDWAWDEQADFFIFDDCDDVPTLDLQGNARELFETTGFSYINVRRLYVVGESSYYPALNMPGQSVWAWRRGTDVKAAEISPLVHDMLNIPGGDSVLMLEYPSGLLHYSWPNDAEIERKIRFYYSTGEGVLTNHPDTWAGPRAVLPSWAVWK